MYYNMDEPWKCYAKEKKPHTKATCCMIALFHLYEISEEQIHRDRK